ncbi:MAG: type II toxin-antitoxin system RelE/ParE family toxin [Kiritimatiellae bacterium]|nr:type II toxin-antitoxin system RelE/ParE family toxin [Kiritimatiellia bacterium]
MKNAMTLKWSPHARILLANVLNTVRIEVSSLDAARWKTKIDSHASRLATFPNLGTVIPVVCFQSIPANADRLRQLICSPYRIVYESVGDEVHILSIRHARMLVAENDTFWN